MQAYQKRSLIILGNTNTLGHNKTSTPNFYTKVFCLLYNYKSTKKGKCFDNGTAILKNASILSVQVNKTSEIEFLRF